MTGAQPTGCSSRCMGSWLPSEAVFAPPLVPVILDYPPWSRRGTSGREAHRVRPERHNPCSIATLRVTMARRLLRQLSGGTFCGTLFYNTVVLIARVFRNP